VEFLCNSGGVKMENNNFKQVRKVLWIILFANLAVAILKICIGSLIRSASMTADGVHSLSDSSSNIVGLIGIKFASKPVDEDHPYGHKKFETLAGLFISAMLLFIGGKIIIDAVVRLFDPIAPNITGISLAALIVTVLINIFVCAFELVNGRRLKSDILISDSMHTRSDIYISVGVLIALIGIRLGLPIVIDPIVSLVVSGFVLHAAYEIFNSTSGVLVDRAVIDADQIREITMGFTQVRDAHKIRSRGREDDLHVDMHIVIEPDMRVEECHKLIHSIEKKIKEEVNQNIQVIVHLEPFREPANQVSDGHAV
jgi:cation diffusion facilitator family transporter